MVETGLPLLYKSHLPLNFWSYAFSTAFFLINRLPSSILGFKSPWELVNSVSPLVFALRTFGCAYYPYLRPYNKHKLQPRSTECIFLGYPPLSKGYLYVDPTTNRVYVTCYALFNENCFPFADNPHLTNSQTPFSMSHEVLNWFSTASSSPTSSTDNVSDIPSPSSSAYDDLLPLSLLSSSISCVPDPPSISNISTSESSSCVPSTSPSSSLLPCPTNSHPMVTRSKVGIHKPRVLRVLTDYTYQEPPSYVVAAKYLQWVATMDSEFHSFQKQQTWSLVPAPLDKNIVTCKWVFKLKKHSDGTLARYKARFVARGYLQQYGLDYDETFSPVVKPATVRLLLALAVNCGWELKQLDVSNAFLHGILKEEVYMAQPQGHVDSYFPTHVCLLHKALYGLKQAPRAWFERFTTQLLHIGFVASGADGNLFIYRHDGHLVFLLLYVDDIIVIGNHPSFTTSLLHQLSSDFDLKDLGKLHYFLGLQIEYTLDLLNKFHMADCKPCNTPCAANAHLWPNDSPLLSNPTHYRSLVGALQYLTFTRSDLSFAV